MKLAWVAPQFDACGIRDYSLELWEHLKPVVEGEGAESSGGDTFYAPLEGVRRSRDLVAALSAFQPDVVHFQHEYGYLGRKIPPFYRFPQWVKACRASLPKARLVATAHTVLPPDYRFPTEGRGWQRPLRELANARLLPMLRRVWGPQTWGALDGVIVHSRLQVPWIEAAGCPRVVEIPLFSPPVRAVTPVPAGAIRRLMVFGFVSPEKGQHLVIEALAQLPPNIHVTIAGSARRKAEAAYEARCRQTAARLGVEGRVTWTGYVAADRMDSLYAEASLVLAPFMETTGSASILQSFRRGLPTLASDHPINRELAERVPEALAFFRLGDAADLSQQVKALLASPARLAALSEGALKYANQYGLPETAQKHLAFYRRILEAKA